MGFSPRTGSRSVSESSLSRWLVPPEVAGTVGGLPAESYDGESARSIARRLAIPSAHLYASVGSTMDAAHALGEGGAPAGTLILAEAQTAGRGRSGRRWLSAPTRGIWLTLLERPPQTSGLPVLSLRIGLAAARALDRFAAAPVALKWPNDLFVAGGKVGGVLIEARWRGRRPDWVAIGLGVNVGAAHHVQGAAGLRDGISRLDVLVPLIPALRDGAAQRGPLSDRELAEYQTRDCARGRRSLTPARGVVVGVTAGGELTLRTSQGIEHFRAGSLVLEEGA
jgi:BirA family transcriptional regulator, biotin operon repressor / biotin---[acetyl-CoA-carboxylase] ligase